MARNTKLQQPATSTSTQPVKKRQVHPSVMAAARKAAGGDNRRLHFHEDGSVVVLNFPGQECPECARVAREQAAVKKKPRARAKS